MKSIKEGVAIGRMFEEVIQKVHRIVDEPSPSFDARRYHLEFAYSGRVLTGWGQPWPLQVGTQCMNGSSHTC